MTATQSRDGKSTRSDDVARLRLDVYDALLNVRGLGDLSVTEQAKLHGVSRAQMYRIRGHEQGVGLALAMRMADDLDTNVETLFERVAA